jgi:tRNA modification GTPase
MSPACDTIFALSSGRVPAAIAVVRISGPSARVALEALSGRVPPPRQASLARLRDPQSGEILDEALALWFPAPRSETGEDMAELQLHGGRAVLAAVLAALARLPGFRPAEAGEFTRRAFENGRLDLTAVEGLADLIGAETEAQRRQAYRQMKGLLGDQAETWRGRLIQALALVEAGIDFSDEADVPAELVRPALDIARTLHDEISAVLAEGGRGERLRDGFVVAIAGPPNAGKSTLLNRIAKREAAIVSPYAGTTRDVIEVHLDLGGYPVTLLDTAGVRDTDDPVEREGVRRAHERAAAADLVLWVVEAGQPMTDFKGQRPSESGSLDDKSGPLGEADGPVAGASPLAEGGSGGARPSTAAASAPGPMADPPPVWLIQNKIDLLPASDRNPTPAQLDAEALACAAASLASADLPPPGCPSVAASDPTARSATHQPPLLRDAPAPVTGLSPASYRNEYKVINEFRFIFISATQGAGIENLLRRLESHVQGFFGGESGLITRERHRFDLRSAQTALARALAESPGREEIVAEELRLASRALGRLTGKVDVEDVLDVIFRDFCIGK